MATLKKTCTLFISLLFIFMLLPFHACSNKTKTINLTTFNYNQYFSVSCGFSDLQISESSKTNAYSTYYNVSCIGTITTSSQDEDYTFSNVSITFRPNTNFLERPIKIDSTLNANGSSSCTFTAYWENSPIPAGPTLKEVEIVEIKGTVTIPA